MFQGARACALDHNVGGLNQSAQYRAFLPIGKIEYHAAFSHVHQVKKTWGTQAGTVWSLKTFYFDDVGARELQ